MEGMVIDNRPGTVGMMQAAKTFIGDPRGFLTIHGSFGTGKSTALKSIVAECVKFGIEAHYTTLSEIMAYAREAFRDPNDTDYGRITRLARIQVLAIDEVDKARLTEYAREIQTHFFDVRYRNAGILGTVLAWNGSFEALDMPWVRSRLTEYPIISNNDADARPMIGGGK